MSETKIGLRASGVGRDLGKRNEAGIVCPGSGVRSLTPAQSYLRQLMLVRIADDRAHAREGGNFFRSTLRIAAGYDDLGPGVLAANATDRGACVPIGRSGYRAGVKHDNSGVARFASALQSSLAELALDGCAVRLSGAASEIFHVEGSQALILTCPVRADTPVPCF